MVDDSMDTIQTRTVLGEGPVDRGALWWNVSPFPFPRGRFWGLRGVAQPSNNESVDRLATLNLGFGTAGAACRQLAILITLFAVLFLPIPEPTRRWRAQRPLIMRWWNSQDRLSEGQKAGHCTDGRTSECHSGCCGALRYA